MDELQRIASGLGEQAKRFDADVLSGDQASAVVRLCTEAERAVQTIRMMAMARVDATSVAARTGHRDSAEWLACEAGVSYQQAAIEVDTARRLAGAPDTETALRAGRLSVTQASLISKAAVSAPHREAELVDAAQRSTVQALKTSCKKIEASTVEDDRRRAVDIHRRRYFRTWTESDGAVRLDARLTPDNGARLLALVEKHRVSLSKAASRADRRQPQAALRADSLMLALDGPGKVRATVNVTVDHAALVRGSKEADEICRIDGVGDVSVTTARQLLDDALLKVLVVKNGDVTAVRSAGRYVPAMLDTALKHRDVVCAVPFCDSTFRIERDHNRERSKGGPTSYENLDRLCKEHHAMKTFKGFRLVGKRGEYQWVGPEDTSP